MSQGYPYPGTGPAKPTQPSQLIAILALVFYNQPEVQAFFAQLNAPEAR